jgi:hypothetical protein
VKKYFSFLIIFLSFARVQAQVNLDQPVSVGVSDTVFRSSADGQAAYLIPTTLMVLDNPRISEIGGEYRAHFEVGMNKAEFDAITEVVKATLGSAKQPLELRMMKGWDARIDEKGSTDTPPKFKSRLEPLGDAGSLGSPLTYMFAVKKIGPKQGKESQSLLSDLFSSSKSRHIGSINYEFNAIRGGIPYQAKTSVGIFARDLGVLEFPGAIKITKDSMSIMSISKPESIEATEAITPVILLDAEKPCWNNIEIGQICLKN